MRIYNTINRRIIKKIKEKLGTLWARLILPVKGNTKIGKKLKVRGNVFVSNYGRIEIGNNVTINSAEWANPIGTGTRTFFQVFPGAAIKIGDNSGISNTAITAQIGVEIGKNVLIGSGVKIYDTDFHPLIPEYRYGQGKDNSRIKKKKVLIEDGAFIGAGSFILKGSIIGKNSVIGAGSIVTGIVPPNQIWGGIPAKFIRTVESLEEKEIG